MTIEISKIKEFEKKYLNEWRIFVRNPIQRLIMYNFFYPNSKNNDFEKKSEAEQYQILKERADKYTNLIEQIKPERIFLALGIETNFFLNKYLLLFNHYFESGNDLNNAKIVTLNMYKKEFGNNKTQTTEEEFYQYLSKLNAFLDEVIRYYKIIFK